MSIRPTTRDAYQLMHEGVLALSEVEANGIRVDTAYLDKSIKDTTKQIADRVAELKKDSFYAAWNRRWGDSTSLGSRSQLAAVLTGECGIKIEKKTKKGRDEGDEEGGGGRVSMDADVLEKIDIPFVQSWLRVEKKKKLLGTYLQGLKREVEDGYVHPHFATHLVRSYRSSSQDPNIQNQIVRDKEAAKILRSCYIPREGHVLTECDYGALEFKGAACLWRDEAMIAYASNPKLDIHRDVAAQVYMLDTDDVTKDARYCGKNKFVFPELYGSDYVNCSGSLWESIGIMELKTKSGIPLKDHLSQKGISEFGPKGRKLQLTEGTFVHHVKEVEDWFCGMFHQWRDRREQWIKRYYQRGWFPLMTGFRCSGIYSPNQLMNFPIQGSCFHLLLWSLIKLLRDMKKRKMRSVIVAEIHDSVVGDIHRAELDDYFGLAKEIMEQEVRKHWDWVVTPLTMEPEVCFPTWADKRSWVPGMSV